MQLTLRPATNRDREALETLVFGVLAEHGLEPDPGATDSDLQDIELSYIACGGIFDVLIDENGQLIGSVGLFPVSRSVCELRKMYLAAPARRLGFGRWLLEHALSRARELGFARVVLETASVLRAAVALYERYGFRRYTPKHLAARCDTAYFLDLPPTQPRRTRQH
jgi:putative acetyltransferase